jgi:hypothetical protein
MARLTNFINGIEGVIAGGAATARFPVTRRYHNALVFVNNTAAATAEAIVDTIQITVNQVLIRDLTSKEFRGISKFNGIALDDNVIPVYFSEPWRRSVTGEESFSWDLVGQSEMVMKINFASPNVGLTCKILAEFDFERNTSLNPATGETFFFLNIMRQTGTTYNPGVGQFDITTLPILNPIHRLHITPAAGTISKIEVYKDDIKWVEGDTAQYNERLKEAKFVPATFGLSVVFDIDQQASSFILVQRTLLVRPTFSASGAARVIMESAANGYK